MTILVFLTRAFSTRMHLTSSPAPRLPPLLRRVHLRHLPLRALPCPRAPHLYRLMFHNLPSLRRKPAGRRRRTLPLRLFPSPNPRVLLWQPAKQEATLRPHRHRHPHPGLDTRTIAHGVSATSCEESRLRTVSTRWKNLICPPPATIHPRHYTRTKTDHSFV